MNTTTDNSRLTDDLAAHWTEPALKILKDAGIQEIGVDMELGTWQTLKTVLHSEFRWQRAFRSLVSLRTLMEQVLARAALLIVQKFDSGAISTEFVKRVRGAISERRTTADEQELYAQVIRHPARRPAYESARRTDFMPRLLASR